MTEFGKEAPRSPTHYIRPRHPRRRVGDRVDQERVLAGSGEAAALMRACDWSKTPLGPVTEWSETLRTMVGVLLRNRFPLMLFWGPELIQLYNDAYRPMAGAKHPRAMGQPARECWSEIWSIIGPLLEEPLRGEPATASDDLLLLIDRKEFLEETHFKFAFSPVPDDTVESTGIGGVLATVAETTEQVYAERQLRTLRELGARAAEATTSRQACEMAALTFAENEFDISFALFYLVESNVPIARLAASCGFDETDGPANPDAIALDIAAASDAWPVRRILETRSIDVIREHSGSPRRLPSGRWAQPPRYALGLPLSTPGTAAPHGVLIVGCNPHRELDFGYLSFFELAAAQISTTIRNANTYEEQRQRAEKLAQLDRAKTAFFSNISHEFRTPLTLMLGPAEDLLAGAHGDLSAPQRQQIELLRRGSLRLRKLVNSLLDFSRIEAGRIEVCYEPVDLGRLTSDLASVFRSAVEQAGLGFDVSCPSLEEAIYVDRDMWEKIVLNLLSNALKFTFAGRIAVALREVDGGVALQVSDTGTGIPSSEMPRLFERFHRIAGVRARTQEGSGIGLAFVQELVKLHGGSVRAESEPGVGTTFTVTLRKGSAHLPADRIGPAAAQTSTPIGPLPFVEEALPWLPGNESANSFPPPSPVGSRALPAAQPKARVMVADDNADMRSYLRGLLARHWQVETFANGQEVLAAAQSRPPDLILTDAMMPGLDGFGLIRALRASDGTRTTPIILLSARAGEEAKVEGLAAGADDYVVKPFSARELLARIRSQIELNQLRREVEEERQEHIAELQQTVRLTETFINVMGHDLRNPLSAISTAGALLSRRSESESALKLTTLISTSAEEMTSMIDQLVDFARIRLGQGIELARVDVDLADICEQVVARADAAHRCSVSLTRTGELRGYWDRNRIRQLVTTLTDNACRHRLKDSAVLLRLNGTEPGAVTLEVWNAGMIPPERLASVFEPATAELDAPRPARDGRLGLGLYLGRQLVIAHGGAIRVESSAQNGTRFIVALPRGAAD